MVHDLLASTPAPLLLVGVAAVGIPAAIVVDSLLAAALVEVTDWRQRRRVRRRRRRRDAGRRLTGRMAVTSVSQDTLDRIQRGA